MGEVKFPIVGGAKYEDGHGEAVRIRSVWVQQDLTTNVQLYDDIATAPVGWDRHYTLSLEDVVSQIESGELTRVNSDHDAWEWREKYREA